MRRRTAAPCTNREARSSASWIYAALPPQGTLAPELRLRAFLQALLRRSAVSPFTRSTNKRHPMKLITWNVQWCRGVDGRVDPARIVAEAKRIADFDVLCLQEIADNFPDPELAGSRGEDQFAMLAELLPGYTVIPGVGVDQPGRNGRRRRFGNLIASRLPVRQAYRYNLPYPLDAGVPGMPRVAVEAVVAASFGELRVITTHLEYYSDVQRMAQAQALRDIYAEGHAYARDAQVTRSEGTPFDTHIRPRATVITGDFNFEPDAPEHARMVEPFADGTPPLRDAWSLTHPGEPHASTFCIYQKTDPSGDELHCDFVFVNDDLAPRARALEVEQLTQASDHQPVILTLG
jgi:endonuclease/exonuclease/phosphatase family metal-dependent hydrolase